MHSVGVASILHAGKPVYGDGLVALGTERLRVRVTVQVFRGKSAVTAFDLPGDGELLLGRDADAGLRGIEHADGVHARLAFTQGRLLLSDSGLFDGGRLKRASGGAWIGVEAASEVEIRHGDSLEFVGHTLRCTFSPPPSSVHSGSAEIPVPRSSRLPSLLDSQTVFDPDQAATRRLPTWWRPAVPDGQESAPLTPPAPAPIDEDEPILAALSMAEDPTGGDPEVPETISGFEIPSLPSPAESAKIISERAQQLMPVRLIVMEGDVPRSQTFAGAVLKIGRGRKQDVRLKDPSVSAKHAEILKAGDGFYVRDLGSRNLTKVDGQPVAKLQEVAVYNNSVISFGDTDSLFICDSYAPGTSAKWDVGRHNVLMGRLFDLGVIEGDSAREVELAMQRAHTKLIETLVLKDILTPSQWLALKHQLPEYGLDASDAPTALPAPARSASIALWLGLILLMLAGSATVLLVWGPKW